MVELVNVILFSLGALFVGLVFGLLISSFFGLEGKYYVEPSCRVEKLSLEVSPLTIPVVEAWNYKNQDVTEQPFGSCTLRRLDKDSWKLDFREC